MLAELGFGTAVICSMYKPIADDDRELVCAYLRFYRKIYRWVGTIIFFAGLCPEQLKMDFALWDRNTDKRSGSRISKDRSDRRNGSQSFCLIDNIMAVPLIRKERIQLSSRGIGKTGHLQNDLCNQLFYFEITSIIYAFFFCNIARQDSHICAKSCRKQTPKKTVANDAAAAPFATSPHKPSKVMALATVQVRG